MATGLIRSLLFPRPTVVLDADTIRTPLPANTDPDCQRPSRHSAPERPVQPLPHVQEIVAAAEEIRNGAPEDVPAPFAAVPAGPRPLRRLPITK